MGRDVFDLLFASRSIRRGFVLVFLGMATTLALVTGPALEQAGATPSSTTFHLSGAVQGTLTQSNSGCGTDVGAFGGQFSYYTKLKGSNNDSWTVNVNNVGKNKKGGTFKKFGGLLGNGVSIVLAGSNGKSDYWWISKSGTLTISSTSGSVSVLLGPDTSAASGKPGKGTIHLTGSWGCLANG